MKGIDSMPSNHINRVNEDIRLCMDKLLREVKDPRIHQGLISVTSVQTSGDMKYCKIYLSVLGLQDERSLEQGLRSASGWLRRELGQRLRLRNTPELTFIPDHSIEEGAHINSILASLDIKPEEGTEDDPE